MTLINLWIVPILLILLVIIFSIIGIIYAVFIDACRAKAIIEYVMGGLIICIVTAASIATLIAAIGGYA